jgi:hypothetical protein
MLASIDVQFDWESVWTLYPVSLQCSFRIAGQGVRGLND